MKASSTPSSEDNRIPATPPRKRITWNIYTFSTISWINPLLYVGNKKPLSEQDLPLIGKGEQATMLASWLDGYIAQTKEKLPGNKPQISLGKALFPRVVPILIADGIAQIITVATSTGQSLLIQQVLTFLEAQNGFIPKGTQVINNGYAWAVIFLVLLLVNAVSTTISSSIGNILELRIKAALVNAIYRKALVLSSKSRSEYPAGKINSFVGSDTQSIMGLIESANKLWSMPLQIGVAMYFVSTLLGVSTAVAAGVFLGLAMVSVAFSPILNTAFKDYMKTMDKRTTVLREFLYGIKVIKYHGLEEHQQGKVLAARQVQIKALYKIVFGFILLIGILILQNTLTAPLTFITFSSLGNAMTATNVFPALSFLSTLMNISGQLPQILFTIAQSVVSYRRLGQFLLAEETDTSDSPLVKSVDESSTESIIYSNASFSWETVLNSEKGKDGKDPKKEDQKGKKDAKNKKNKPVAIGPSEDIALTPDITKDIFKLENFSVSIKRGSLVAVVGATGSGKSSLLSSMAGVMRKTDGDAVVYGTLSYCPQDPWIISGTIEQNITLLDSSLVGSCAQAIEVCSLTKDLNSFPSGVKTQIGEKGINLSGGQKARIALARAIAKNPDIYILDDPLSALDAHVSKSVFDEAINGPLMKSKTVVIATHLLHILPNVDHVIVMDQGKIVQSGGFQELMADASGKLVDIMKGYHLDDESEEDAIAKKATKEVAKTDTADDEVAEAEDRQTGSVSGSVYVAYIHAIGYTWTIIQVVTVLLLCAIYVVQQLTLSAWTSNYWGLSATTYLILYSCLGASNSVIDVSNFAYTNFSTIKASQYFHNSALSGLVAAPMSFYNNQPIGRILNRMTADVRSLDNGFGFILNALISQTYMSLAILIIACYSAWQVIPIVAALLVVLYVVYRFFRNSYRELRRLMSIMQSPLTAHVSETLTGLPSIAAYRAEKRFIEHQMEKLDQSNLANLLFTHSMFWITIRLNLLGSIVTFAIAVLGVSGVMPYALVGASLTQITLFAPTIQFMLIMLATLEANMVAVERLNFYAHSLPKEAPRILPKDATLSEWPKAGSIDIEDLTLAYESRPDHTVINGVSLHISAGEKVGVVGRTGSGKSTLMDAFFRLLEAKEGRIKIDGEDIATIGLKKLRTSIQMIPQSPTLFDGTVRSNIDTLGKYSDEELWYALECVGMKEYVSGLTDKLDSAITEGGTNLSAGQRQLLCLAIVLLEKAKILIMDEATSSVDAESDKRIQDSMKTHFKAATVLSVAHRLNTIAAFDKVLVLENGQVVEFDAPHVLLANPRSIFSEMVDATGVANAVVIAEVAKAHYESRN
ncbi:Multidrug resistance-associated protein 1 [Physocladia obscura]|uniref:Multidrug resistance-associated protein 1 n=1 Tax=Physocladia obscura TaxID=109957 RepID=A0AAD5XJ43_9FUNG|nr:Multidrug resistance-associated protein 1 [Physocladia obscura]